MKSFFSLCFLTLLFCHSVVAQITITRSNLGTLVGKTFIGVNTETDVENISPGNSGPNQTWNFSMLQNESEDILPFVNPATLPCASDFPTSNLAISYDDESAGYLVDNNSFLDFIGFCDVDPIGGNFASKYTVPERIVSFPLTYNSSFSGQSIIENKEESDIPGFDSTRFITTSNYNYTVDGWGNVITPEGTFPCLRKKNFSITTFTLEVKGPIGWFSLGEPEIDTSYNYEFYSQNSLFIANISQDASGVTRSAAYFKDGTVGVKKLEANAGFFQVLPNPSQGRFTFKAEQPGINSIQIFNQLGSEIAHYNFEGVSFDFDLKDFPSGIYHLKAGDGIKQYSLKIVKE